MDRPAPEILPPDLEEDLLVALRHVAHGEVEEHPVGRAPVEVEPLDHEPVGNVAILLEFLRVPIVGVGEVLGTEDDLAFDGGVLTGIVRLGLVLCGLGLRGLVRRERRCEDDEREGQQQNDAWCFESPHRPTLLPRDYRRKRIPAGWFEPWICEWQFRQPRSNIRLPGKNSAPGLASA